MLWSVPQPPPRGDSTNLCGQLTLVECSLQCWVHLLFRVHVDQAGWESCRGSAGGKGDSEFILNPSGHWSCKQAGNSWGEWRLAASQTLVQKSGGCPSRQGPAGGVGRGERGRATPWSPVHVLASDVQRAETQKPEASQDNTDPGYGYEDCLGPLPKGCHFVCSQMERVHNFV